VSCVRSLLASVARQPARAAAHREATAAPQAPHGGAHPPGEPEGEPGPDPASPGAQIPRPPPELVGTFTGEQAAGLDLGRRRVFVVWEAPGARDLTIGVHCGPRAWEAILARLETGAYRCGVERLRGYHDLAAALHAWGREGPQRSRARRAELPLVLLWT
jgi:hypothetical protein